MFKRLLKETKLWFIYTWDTAFSKNGLVPVSPSQLDLDLIGSFHRTIAPPFLLITSMQHLCGQASFKILHSAGLLHLNHRTGIVGCIVTELPMCLIANSCAVGNSEYTPSQINTWSTLQLALLTPSGFQIGITICLIVTCCAVLDMQKLAGCLQIID